MTNWWRHYRDHCHEKWNTDQSSRDWKEHILSQGKSSKRWVEDFDFTLCVMGSEETLDETQSDHCIKQLVKILKVVCLLKGKTNWCIRFKWVIWRCWITKEIGDSRGTHHISFAGSLALDEPLSKSSPLVHACSSNEQSADQTFRLCSDEEVTSLNDAGNIYWIFSVTHWSALPCSIEAYLRHCYWCLSRNRRSKW